MFDSDDTGSGRAERASPLPRGGAAGTHAEPSPGHGATSALSASERHRRARLAREGRKQNPLLQRLAADGRVEPHGLDDEPADEVMQDPWAQDDAFAHDDAFPAGDAAAEPREAPAAHDEPQFAEREIFIGRARRAAVEDDAPASDGAGGIVATLRDWRLPIAALTGIGLAAGLAVALSAPQRYTAHARLLLDPRQVELLGGGVAPANPDGELARAIVDSQLGLIRSPALLGKVVQRANLQDDPEFNGVNDTLGGVFGSVRAFWSIVTGDDTVDERGRSAMQALDDRLAAERARDTFIVDIGVTTLDAQKSARIADEVTTAFIEERETLRAKSAGAVSTALGGRLESLRADVEAAERALQRYRAENGLLGPEGRLVTDDELTVVTGQLAAAKAATIAAQARADTAGSADVVSILSGGLPQELVTDTLSALRAQHAAERREIASLRNALGPRHPKLGEAEAALRSVEADIAAELRRIVEGAQADLRRATQAEQTLAASLAELKAASVHTSEAGIGLRELQRKVDAARQLYEAALLRAREAGEIETLGTADIQVIAPAEAPQQPSSLSRMSVIAGFGGAGLALGLTLALLAGLRRALSTPANRAQALEIADAASGFDARQDELEYDRSGIDAADAGQADEGIEFDDNASEADMYPYPPHYYAYPPQADPAQQPVAQPAPWPAQPMPVAYAPPQPVYAWPMPAQPMPPQPYAGAYPPYGWPVPPQPMPAQQMPTHQMPQHAMPAQPAPAYAPPPQAPAPRATAPRAPQPPAPNEELEDLRQSVRDLRDTVETLMRRRSERSSRAA
ncbi:GumC family protein [Oricola sp.]|uniref:GumC family protein n=1 Tax=Oricola sp. TaxID=1979950 RepID=UPI0025CF16F0|nr:GumC family protein [Oricola sp.]MCI5078402.1 GumC family protein [Oricola sp.]